MKKIIKTDKVSWRSIDDLPKLPDAVDLPQDFKVLFGIAKTGIWWPGMISIWSQQEIRFSDYQQEDDKYFKTNMKYVTHYLIIPDLKVEKEQ